MPSTAWCYPTSASRRPRGARVLFRRGGKAMMKRWLTVLSLSAACLPAAASAQDAGAYLRRAAAATGSDAIQSLRFVAKGSALVGGQACSAGKPGARANIHSLTRTLDYANGAI